MKARKRPYVPDWLQDVPEEWPVPLLRLEAGAGEKFMQDVMRLVDVNAGQDPRESTGVIDGRIADRKIRGLNYSRFY